MRSLAHDFTAAARSFRRHPAFALAVLLTLSLGIAPNCAIFAIVNAVYLRPLPYPEQQRLALLNVSHARQAAIDQVDAFTFRAWEREATSIESLAAYRNASFNLNTGDRPERVSGQLVTPSFFRTVGFEPSLGRTFRSDDGHTGAAPVIVISERTWRDYFSGRTDILGAAVRVNGVQATVIGVMPARFTSFMEGRAARVWVPLQLSDTASPEPARTGNVIARLKPGVTAERAAGELAALDSSLATRFPDFYRDRRAVVRDFRGALFGGLGPGLRMLSVVVGLLLLIACGNAANLLLGRSAHRAREMALRTALGAGRTRLVRAALAESTLLAFGAAGLGLVFAYGGLQAIWAWSAPLFVAIGVNGFEVDRQVVGFAVALAAVTTLLFGAWPALRGSRLDVAGVLKDGGAGSAGGRRYGRMSRSLVVAQVTLCVVTMIATSLMVRSVLHFSAVSANPGFRPEPLLVASLPFADTDQRDPQARRALLEEAERRIAALPGIERVAAADRLPFLEAGNPVDVFKAGAGERDEVSARVPGELRVVDPDYFPILAVPLLKGRTFTADDTTNNLPVAVISDRLAAAGWEHADPIGERIRVDGTWRTIVGVVASSVEPSPFRPTPREVFVPYAQVPPGDCKLLVHSARGVSALAPAIRAEVRAVDVDQPVVLQSMTEALDNFMSPFRLILLLISVFGTIALLLAAIGLYAVIAQGVARRLHEIGIRLALGARRGTVVAMILRDGVRLSLVGLVLGLLLGLAIARLLPSEILGVRALSVFHYAGIASAWLLVAAVASLVPARTAARLDPVSALRRD